MNFNTINEEVLYTTEDITKVNRNDIRLLKSKASKNRRKRIRLCVHKNAEDALHEMLIVLAKGAYVRPHKHLNKSESFHLIEGSLNIVIFDELGISKNVIHLGDYASKVDFFYRISESSYHTVIPLSDNVVFHETTNGPFRRNDTTFAKWAPTEDDTEGQELYMKSLNEYLAHSL